jgi:hypothetical protein
VSAIQARRYIYGKAVQEPGGAVNAGFEHQVTRQGRGLSPRLLEYCHPLALIERTSTLDLVHVDAHARGALFLWPVRCDDRDYMILGRVRPRPEAGEGRPGRTYTQLNTAIIAGADWCAQAPEILAAVPDWLRADPDLESELDPKDAPPLDLPVPDDPLYPDSDPLPGLDNWPWALLRGLEDRSRPTLAGSDAGLPDERAFCRALGQALALLPPPLRILVTACAGFAAPRPEFAIQFIPEARPETPDRTLGYFGQLAEGHHCLSFADWRGLADEKFADLDQAILAADWHNPGAARGHAARLIGKLARGLVVDYLQRFLDGELPRCPALPAGPDAADLQPLIVIMITDCLRQRLQAGRPSQAVARAAEVAAAELNGPEWTRAWTAATRKADQAVRTDILLWSALRSDDRHDDPERWIGVIWSFTALAHIRRLTSLIGDYHRDAGLTDSRVLRHAGLAARVERLLARAPNLLRDHPAEIVPLAETLPDAFAKHPAREAVLARLKELIPVLGLLALAPGAKVRDLRALYAAAGGILSASYGIALPPPEETQDRWCRQAPCLRPVCFDYCLQTAIAGNTEGASFWGQALACTLLAGSDVKNAAVGLLGLVKVHPAVSVQEVAERLDKPFAAIFKSFAASTKDPGTLADAILAALAEQGPYLASEPGNNRLRLALARSLQETLSKAIAECRHTGLAQIAPTAARLLSDTAKASPGNTQLNEFYCELGRQVLDRMVRTGHQDRNAAIDLMIPLETLVHRSPRAVWNSNPATMNPKRRNDREIAAQSQRVDTSAPNVLHTDEATARRNTKREGELAEILKALIVSWIQTDPPKPWFVKPKGTDLASSPVRLRLARSLGFPRCVYMGWLTDSAMGSGDETLVSDRSTKTTSRSRQPVTIPAISAAERQVMALCATVLWRKLYATPGFANRSQIVPLLKSDGADEALIGVADLAAEGEPRMLRALGDDIVFLADFFRLVGPQPRTDTTPAAVRKVLLGVAIEEDVRSTCFPLFLGRSILTASVVDLAIGDEFRKALRKDKGVTAEILGSTTDFANLSDAAVAARIDRVLFGLGLVYVQPLHGNALYGRAPIPNEQFSAFALTLGQKQRIAEFFSVMPDYSHAFERAVKFAGNPCLDSWPWQ